MSNDAIPAFIFCGLRRPLETEHGWIKRAIAIAMAWSSVEKRAEYLLAFSDDVLSGLGSSKLWFMAKRLVRFLTFSIRRVC